MAASRTRKHNSRQADYTNIGVAGRKTGVTLKDTGIRDEHGLEPIEGIFSSPEKPASNPRSNGNNAIVDDEDMSIEDSTVPEPMDMLSMRRATRPPRSRSPVKTNIGSSPRKSLGPPPSPFRTTKQSNSIIKDHTATPDNARAQAPNSSLSATKTRPLFRTDVAKVHGATRTPSSTSEKRKRVFDINTSDTEDEVTEFPNVEASVDDPSTPPADVLQSQDIQLTNDSHPDGAVEASDIQQSLQDDDDATFPEQIEPIKPASRRRGRPKAASGQTTNDENHNHKSKPLASNPLKGRRGRPPKTTDLPQSIGIDGDKENNTRNPQRQRKKAKTDNTEEEARQPPPSRRNPNARVIGPGPSMSPSTVTRDRPTSETGKPKPRSLLVLRSETPAEETGAQVLRSGRTSVKPLAYWRNERIVYDKHNIDGVRLPLQGIKEIVRTEEAPPPERKSRRRGRQPRKLSSVDEEDDDEPDDWERETGILEAAVMEWDPETQRGLEDSPVEIELAYAAKGLDEATREVKNSTFQYGKTVTLPFFHSGVVDLPPQGEKKMKNSRRNHMVFWVFSGRVDVDVSNNKFSIGRGGMWQVPRGNFYNLTNPYDRPARVFFAQGCYMAEKEGLEVSE